MRFGVRHIVILTGSFSFAAPAPAETPRLHAIFAPHAMHGPTTPAAPPCTGDNCALNALQDIWKRDALKKDRQPDMNANAVILDRARFQKDAERFGTPDATAIFNYDILGSGICVGAFKGGAFGIHTC